MVNLDSPEQSAMNLRSLWFKFGAICVCFAVILIMIFMAGLQVFFAPMARDLESQRARLDIDRVTGALFHELTNLHQYTLDWAAWDDTYRFVESPYPEYIESNLGDATFVNLKIDAMMLYKPNGEVVWGKTLDQETGETLHVKELPLDGPPDPGFILGVALGDFKDPYSGYSGIMGTESGLMFVSVRPVFRSNLTGPANGVLLFGRLVRGRLLQNLQQLVGVPFAVFWMHDPKLNDGLRNIADRLTVDEPIYTREVSNSKLEGYTLIPDIESDLSILVRINADRDFFNLTAATFDRAMSYASYLLTAVLGIFAFLVLMLVLRPLARLEAYVRRVQSQPQLEKLDLPKLPRDEIGKLGRAFYQLLCQLQEQSEKLREMSFRDELTGLANRRAVIGYLDERWKLALEQKSDIAVIICDVDYFKDFNDHYGHDMGDEVLKEVASALRRGANKRLDLVARYGGEEFLIVLPGADLHIGEQVAERLVKRVYEMKLPHHFSQVAQYVSVSCGVAAGSPGEDETKEEWIRLADEALYKAKESGRNRFAAINPADLRNMKRSGSYNSVNP
ncbi:diguanylate cyclase [Hahella sp. KA22]|nr:diguanylate cyclase [Hahella sp. KA22]QAY54881.1 diguanylate cyclase [Hahella sp. KA22]